jgi:hypothetical protein
MVRNKSAFVVCLSCLAAICAYAQAPPASEKALPLPGLSAGGAIDPTQFPGSDIGAQINAAFAACRGHSIHIQIPPGRYSFSTPIVFSGACSPQIDAAGVEMDYQAAGKAISFSGLNISGGFGEPKMLRGLHLVYQGHASDSVVGVAVGDAAGKACCGTGIRLENDWLDNFGIDLLFGSNAWNFSAIGDYFSANDAGKTLVSFPAGATNSGESLRFLHSTFFSSSVFLTNGVDIKNGATSSSWDGDNFDNVEVALLAGNNNMSSPYWENPDAVIPAGHFFLVTGATGALFNPYFAPNRGWAGPAPHFMASIAGSWSVEGSQASGVAAPHCTAFYSIQKGARFTLTGTRNGCNPFQAADGANVTTIVSETGNAATFFGVSPQVRVVSGKDASGNETTPAVVLENGGSQAQFSMGTMKAGSRSADGDGLISTSNGNGLQNHIIFHNGKPPFSEAEIEMVAPSSFDGDVGFESGIHNDSRGFKHVRVTSTCTTTASPGAACTFPVVFSGGAFLDTNFTSTCTAVGETTGVPILTVRTATVSHLTLQIQAGSAAAATIREADCVAVHD